MDAPEQLNAEFRMPNLKTVLFKHPVRLFCGECKKYIPSTMPWVCGHCEMKHPDPRLYSFLYKCKRCKKKPESFVCPHCKTVWSFEEHQDATHPAQLMVETKSRSEVVPPVVESPQEKRRREHAEDLEELRLKIEKANRQQELDKLEKGVKTAQKSQRDLEDEKCDRLFETTLGDKGYERRKEKEINEKYRNDPDGLADALEALRAAMIKRIE